MLLKGAGREDSLPRLSVSALLQLSKGSVDYSAPLLQVEKLLRAYGCKSTSQLLEMAQESASRLQAFFEAEEHEVCVGRGDT